MPEFFPNLSLLLMHTNIHSIFCFVCCLKTIVVCRVISTLDVKKVTSSVCVLLGFERALILSYPHLFKHSLWGFVLFGQKELILKKKCYSNSVLFLITTLEVQLQRISWGKTSSIINVSCIILKRQCFDTLVRVKDHLGNVILLKPIICIKYLSWTPSYKKTNTGKCSFITTSPRLQGAL